MAAQEYTIKEWKPWLDRETGEVVKDQNGNHKGSVVFNEYASEPLDATFKPPVQVGQKKYGEIESYTTKAGAVRQKFSRRDRPNDFQKGGNSKGNYQPKDDASIQAQWALGQAVQLSLANGKHEDWAWIESTAKKLKGLIPVVKASGADAILPDDKPVPIGPAEIDRPMAPLRQAKTNTYEGEYSEADIPPEFR